MTQDYDRAPRPHGAAPDGGADELGADEAAAPSLLVTVAVDHASVSPGGRLVASVGVVNPGMAEVVDFYRGLVLPGGQTIVFFTEGGGVSSVPAGDVPGYVPVARAVTLEAPFAVPVGVLFAHTWTGPEPRGAYLLFLVAVRAGALADGGVDPGDVLAASVGSFEFH